MNLKLLLSVKNFDKCFVFLFLLSVSLKVGNGSDGNCMPRSS